MPSEDAQRAQVAGMVQRTASIEDVRLVGDILRGDVMIHRAGRITLAQLSRQSGIEEPILVAAEVTTYQVVAAFGREGELLYIGGGAASSFSILHPGLTLIEVARRMYAVEMVHQYEECLDSERGQTWETRECLTLVQPLVQAGSVVGVLFVKTFR